MPSIQPFFIPIPKLKNLNFRTRSLSFPSSLAPLPLRSVHFLVDPSSFIFSNTSSCSAPEFRVPIVTKTAVARTTLNFHPQCYHLTVFSLSAPSDIQMPTGGPRTEHSPRTNLTAPGASSLRRDHQFSLSGIGGPGECCAVVRTPPLTFVLIKSLNR